MKPAALVLTVALAAPAAQANEFEPMMRDFVTNHVMVWTSDPVLINAIRQQNRSHADVTQADIDSMDRTWRAQVDTDNHPLVDSVVENPAADFLREQLMASAGVISELFIMDEHGLNVAASGATSDYWQGDEDKFTESYGAGKDAMHVGDIEFDESSQGYLGQVSLPVIDPQSGAVIGAITIGLNAEMLF